VNDDMPADLDAFRASVRDWCRENVPRDWRGAQTGVSDEGFVSFQKDWFQQLRGADYAVPHWPSEWGGGMPVAEQVVLYQELAAADAPRLVLAFVSIHHAASTLLVAGTDEQRRRHLPAILDGEIWVQGFSEPEAGSDLASLKTTARSEGDTFVVNGQKLWASGAMHADWCLLLARSDVEAPKRKGISYLLMDPQRDRRVALLRDLPRRRGHPGRKPGGRRERRLAGGPGDSQRRARHDHARAGRAARQCRVPMAGGGLLAADAHRDTPDRRLPRAGPARGIRDRDRRASGSLPGPGRAT
jgi:alkylation response protein AidB-like acyl-CoA dehydrogenase